MTAYSESQIKFCAWVPGRPNTDKEGSQENCAIANLQYLHVSQRPSFNWFDVSCEIRGVPLDHGKGLNFNPICEQYEYHTGRKEYVKVVQRAG